jgi:hypothetical protein
METAGKVLLVSAVVLAIVGLGALGALGLAKLGVERVPGTLSWESDNVTVFVSRSDSCSSSRSSGRSC